MNVDDIRTAVGAVRAVAHDDEVAHSQEDALLWRVLEAIAAGADNPAEMAREALKTAEIKFSRWYA